MTAWADRGGRVRGARPGEPDVLVVGAASRDITADDPRGWRLGGGVAYAALASARLGLRTAAIIGLDPPAFAARELDLLAGAGVRMRRVGLAHGPVFRNDEVGGRRVQACLDPGEPMRPLHVPGSWRGAPAWILAPVAGELGDAWADLVGAHSFVALGWQGLLRTLRAGTRVGRRAPAPARLVRRADLVSLSEHDVAPGTRGEDLAALLRPGTWLVVTAGAAGGQAGEATEAGLGGIARYAAVAAEREVDATGAGDTFLAALVARLVRPGPGADAAGAMDPAGATGHGAAGDARGRLDLGFAAAAASFTVEGPGLTGVADRVAVLHRLTGARGQSLAEPPSSST